jgi:hypothetical protein
MYVGETRYISILDVFPDAVDVQARTSEVKAEPYYVNVVRIDCELTGYRVSVSPEDADALLTELDSWPDFKGYLLQLQREQARRTIQALRAPVMVPATFEAGQRIGIRNLMGHARDTPAHRYLRGLGPVQ